MVSLLFTKPIDGTNEGHSTISRRLTAFGYEILMVRHLALSFFFSRVRPSTVRSTRYCQVGKRGSWLSKKKNAVLRWAFLMSNSLLLWIRHSLWKLKLSISSSSTVVLWPLGICIPLCVRHALQAAWGACSSLCPLLSMLGGESLSAR